MKLKYKTAFTLVEISIVIILVGIIAAFAIPNYQKSVSKIDERTVITNLNTIRTAVEIYLSSSGNTTIPTWGNLSAINEALGLHIVDNKIAYHCEPGGSESNKCWAIHPSGWMVHFHDNYDVLHCSTNGSDCPSCEYVPSGGLIGCGQ